MDDFNEKVVENLKNEIECLNYSLAKARQDGNFSMYKNLINSYRETVVLINELSGNNLKEKPSIIVKNGTITNENGDVILSKDGINITSRKLSCRKCGCNLDESKFYEVDGCDKIHYTICKNCIRKIIIDKYGDIDIDKFKEVLQDMDERFDEKLFYKMMKSNAYNTNNFFGSYLKNIYCIDKLCK
ncbi:hypothetical protein QB607_003241 [Clostridium botulinum]|nr:hypothetical protein [Clostridium botulinum]EKS4395914.1 hypothetical protein [Clostridium botulinum]